MPKVVGHEVAYQRLKDGFQQSDTVSFLLYGDEGVGKRTVVKKVVLELYGKGPHEDVHWFKPDGNSLKIAQVRELLGLMSLIPRAPYRLFVIEGVDRMTTAGADALLKSLEEGPAQCRFFLVTNQLHNVPGTVRSRCAPIPFYRLSDEVLTPFLISRGVQAGNVKTALAYAEGSIGRALAHMNKSLGSVRKRSMAMVQAIVKGPLENVGQVLATYPDESLLPILQEMVSILNDVIRFRAGGFDAVSGVDGIDLYRELGTEFGDKAADVLEGFCNLFQISGRPINMRFQLETLIVLSRVRVRMGGSK